MEVLEKVNKKKVLAPKLRFKGFENEWKYDKLEGVADINPSCKNLPEQFIYIDLESVVKGQLLKENQILKNESPSRAQRLLQQNDILFQMVRPYQMNNLFFDKKGEYVASTGYAQIRTKENPKFIYQYLHLQKFVDKVIERCTGTSYPSINSSDLANIFIAIPSLPEQQKIASFLSAVDEKIQQLTRKKELLEQYKKGCMQRIFSGKLRFKDERGKDYPKWDEKKLGDVLDLQHGYQFRTSDFTREGLAIIKISNVIGSSLNLEDLSYINPDRYEEFKKFEIRKGDILMSLTGNIGRVVVVDSIPFKMIQNYRVGKFTPYDVKYLSSRFAKHLLMSDAIFGRFGQLANQSAQANFGKQDMDKINVEIPSSGEQEKIAAYLSSIDDKIENVNCKIAQTQIFKKGLLQQMFV